MTKFPNNTQWSLNSLNLLASKSSESIGIPLHIGRRILVRMLFFRFEMNMDNNYLIKKPLSNKQIENNVDTVALKMSMMDAIICAEQFEPTIRRPFTHD